jgi:hypothetical protein
MRFPNIWTYASLGLTATALTRTRTPSSRTFGMEVSCTSAVWLGSILIAFIVTIFLLALALTIIRLPQNGPRCAVEYFYIGEQTSIVSTDVNKHPRTTLRAHARKRFENPAHECNQMDRGVATPTFNVRTEHTTPAPKLSEYGPPTREAAMLRP